MSAHRMVFTASQQEIEIEPMPFAKGGEGAVHKILSPGTLQSFCVKLYYDKYRTAERRQKIEYMVGNPPPGLNSRVYMVCWPSDVVFDTDNPTEKKFLGFLMPAAWQDNTLLYGLCLPTSPASKPWLSTKFDRKTSLGQESRLKLIVNIASAVHSIHASKHYVFVDMKPQNILLTADAKIAIVDLDSIQIADKKKVLFGAKVLTPEYMPPEASAIQLEKDCVPEHWDQFSLAVVFYQVLFGLHPYMASFKGGYADIATPREAIKHGLFVHGSKRHHIHALPPPHQAFEGLDAKLKSLFKRAFDIGFRHPKLRPSAAEWGETIHGLLVPMGKRRNSESFLAPHTQALLEHRIRNIQSILKHGVDSL